MGSSTAGSCVVCGAESKLRCGLCLKAGLGEMFFCSAEHQKLTWSVHKKVCGERSMPFRYPSLSEDEVKELEEMLDLSPRREWPTDALWTLGEFVATRIWGEEPKDALTRLGTTPRSLLEPCIEGAVSAITAENLNNCLFEIRSYALPIAGGSVQALGVNRDSILVHNVWQRVVSASQRLTKLPEPYPSRIKHLILTYCTLRKANLRRDHQAQVDTKYAHGAVRSFIENNVSPVYPDQARAMLENHDLLFL